MKPFVLALSAALAAAPVLAQTEAPAITAPAPVTAPPPSDAPVAVRTVSAEELVAATARFSAFSMGLARMAITKDVDAASRAFADKLLADHAVLADRIRTLPGWDDPRQTGAVTQTYDRLAALDGPRFQEEFLAAEAEAIAEAMRVLTGYAETGDDPALRDFAVGALPTLLEHQTDIADLRG